jgi:AraC family transcriptional regulator, L-rhamnose operon regulatory protein RhaS
MKTLQLHQEIDITVFRTSDFSDYELHKHNFFEIVFVRHGKGLHIVNDNRLPYNPGSLFVLTPTDVHTFEVKTETELCLIVFNKAFFSNAGKKRQQDQSYETLFREIEYILLNYQSENQMAFVKEQEMFITQLIAQLVKTYQQPHHFSQEIIKHSVFLLLLTIVAKMKQGSLAQKKNADSLVAQLADYIHLNVYEKNRLRLDNLAETFMRSKEHLSSLFKKETGKSIKEYILDYKLNLAKIRLQYSDLTVSQIANELGFTDESHLNKMFKSKFSQTAKQYRQVLAGSF